RAGGFHHETVRCLFGRGSARLQQNDENGYLDFLEALEITTSHGLTPEACFAYHNLAELHLIGGECENARRLVETGLALCRRRGIRQTVPWLGWTGVMVAIESGRWDDAIRDAGEVLAHTPDPGQPATATALWIARVHAWQGDRDRARELEQWFLPRA